MKKDRILYSDEALINAPILDAKTEVLKECGTFEFEILKFGKMPKVECGGKLLKIYQYHGKDIRLYVKYADGTQKQLKKWSAVEFEKLVANFRSKFCEDIHQ